MLIVLDVALRISLVKPKLLQQLQNVRVNWDLGEANDNAFFKKVVFGLHLSEPIVLADVLRFEPPLRIRVEDAFHKVLARITDELWDLEITVKNLFVELCSIRVLKWKVPANQSEKDHTCAPQIHV